MKNTFLVVCVMIFCLSAITIVSADNYCQGYLANELRQICAKCMKFIIT